MTDQPTIEIEYCVPCGLLDAALRTERALLEAYGREVATVTLRTGHGGVFKVKVGDEIVFDKAEDAFELDTVLQRVDDQLPAPPA